MGLKGLRRAVATGVMKLNDSLPPVPQTHSAWAAAERAFWQPPEIERRAGFWKSQLDGSRRLWSHHAGSARGTGPLARCVCSLPANLTRGIKDLAVKNGATLFSTLLAGFQVALEKWTGQDDTVVGTPVANRNKEAVRQTMGYFAGIVPLRGQLDRRMTFSQHLASVHSRAVDCFAHAMPFAELARTLNESSGPGQHSIFDVRFALQNHPVPDVVLPRISTRLRMRSTGTARFDLACELTESGAEMEVVWLHREAMISRKEVMELDELFRSVLVRICQNPESRLDVAIVPHS
jgi:non-ribosomal peptide synthetase component F